MTIKPEQYHVVKKANLFCHFTTCAHTDSATGNQQQHGNNQSSMNKRLQFRNSQLLRLEMHSTKATWAEMMVERGAVWYLGQHCSYFQPLICLPSEKKCFASSMTWYFSTVLFQPTAPSSLYFTFPPKAFKSPNEIN